MRVIADYEKAYLEDYDFENILVKYRRKKVLEEIYSYKYKNKKKCDEKWKVLEIGCGMEPLFLYADDSIEFTVVEPGTVFYENAMRKSNESDVKVRIEHDFFEKIAPKLNDKYDIIICSGLINEVEDADKMMEAMKYVSDENTMIHINTANANSFHRVLAKESGLIESVTEKSERNIILQQQCVFTIDSLCELVESHNGKIMKKGSYFVKPFTHKQMSDMLYNDIIDERILDGFYAMSKYIPDMGCEIFINFTFL